jgi:hypothetical protein
LARLPEAWFAASCSPEQLLQFGVAVVRNQGEPLLEPQPGLVYIRVGDRMSLLTLFEGKWVKPYPYPEPVHDVPAHDGGSWWGFPNDGTYGFSWAALVNDMDGTTCVTCVLAEPKDGQFELRFLAGPHEELQPNYRYWLRGFAGVTEWRVVRS